jgi:hypothetical protein
MSDKPAAPARDGAPPKPDDAPQRNNDEFRLLCRRYSRFRARSSG